MPIRKEPEPMRIESGFVVFIRIPKTSKIYRKRCRGAIFCARNILGINVLI